MTATHSSTAAPGIDVPPPPPLPPAGPPPRGLTDRPGRVLVLLVGGLITLAVLALGTFTIVTLVAHDESTSSVSFPSTVRHLEVDVGRGDVTIVGQALAERDGITGTRTVVRGLTSPSYRESVDGDTLTIESSCTAFIHWCSTSYFLWVPPSVVVDIRSTSGDVHVLSVEGAVTLTASSGLLSAESVGSLTAETSSGAIFVTGAHGSVDLRTHSGDIVASGLEDPRARADTTSGDIVMRFGADPSDVEAHATSGDVALTVPDDRARYRVDTSTSSGDVVVLVDPDPAGERRVTVSTSSGDITMSYARR